MDYTEAKVRNRSRIVRNNIRSRCKRRGIRYNLDRYADALAARIAVGVCELSGFPLDLAGSRTYNSLSVDRIVPSRGYVYSNIRLVCLCLNMGLSNWGDRCAPVFRMWLEKRWERQQNPGNTKRS